VKIITSPNLEVLATKTASHLAATINRLLETQPHVVIGLPGGRSPIFLFEELSKRTDIPWDKIHFFLVDERLVPIDHPDSNFRLVSEVFFSKLQPTPYHLHPFHSTTAYEQELKTYGGRFDIVILGVGEDGHTAALFPHHPALKSEAEYFITIDNSPKPPVGRMTSSVKLLQRSQVAYVLFIGESKRAAYVGFLNPEVSLEDCPVKIINQVLEVFIVTDLNN